MRIIGGRDFYDGAGMGVDASVIYKRTPMPTPELFEGIALPRGYTRIVRGVTHKVSPFVILLAGEAFPGIRHYRDEFGKPTSISTIYDAEEALALLEYLEKSHRVQLLPRLSANRMSYEELMRLPSDRFTEWAVETKTVVGLIRSAKRVANETVLVEVKPGKLAAIKAQTVIEREGCRLGDLGFASRLDPPRPICASPTGYRGSCRARRRAWS